MRLVFCGSGDFAIPSLQAVLAAGHEVAALVTQPARPAGRGGHVRHTPLAVAALAQGLQVLEIEKINQPEGIAAIAGQRPEVIVVAAFGQMVRRQVRATAPLGAFNLHASLLPELRGAAPINWAIIRGHRKTGVTTFSLVDLLDAGPIYLQTDTEIRPDETAAELKDRLSAIGADLVCRTLEQLASGAARPQGQDDSKATLAPRMEKSDGLVDWSASAEEVRNLVHGTWPWPAAQTVFESGTRQVPVEIARAHVAEGEAAGLPGTIGGDLAVATRAGRLQIVELKPAGKRLMTWRDFTNGYRVKAGDRFVQK